MAPTADPFEITDDHLQRYAVAFSSDQVFIVDSGDIGSWISDPKIPKIVHDGKSLSRLHEVEGIIFDTSLAAYVLNPGVRTNEMSNLLERWGDGSTLNLSTPESLLASTARNLFMLRHSIDKELDTRGISSLLYDVELPVSSLLALIERRGIAVDAKKLSSLLSYF